MGRLLAFLARILQDGWAASARAIAIEEGAVVLLEPDGQAKVIGSGSAYFLEAKDPPEVCRRKTLSVHRVPPGGSFDVKDWKGTVGDEYQLAVANGELKAIGSNHGIY
jgi:cyanophycinase